MVQIHSHRPLNSVQSGDILYRPFLRHALHPWAKWVVKVYLKFVQLADFVVDVVDFQFHPAPPTACRVALLSLYTFQRAAAQWQEAAHPTIQHRP